MEYSHDYVSDFAKSLPSFPFLCVLFHFLIGHGRRRRHKRFHSCCRAAILYQWATSQSIEKKNGPPQRLHNFFLFFYFEVHSLLLKVAELIWGYLALDTLTLATAASPNHNVIKWVSQYFRQLRVKSLAILIGTPGLKAGWNSSDARCRSWMYLA